MSQAAGGGAMDSGVGDTWSSINVVENNQEALICGCLIRVMIPGKRDGFAKSFVMLRQP